MTKKAQKLKIQDVMEGLAEFATFMSYQSDYDSLRILSVETIEQARLTDEQTGKPMAEVIPITQAKTLIYSSDLKMHDFRALQRFSMQGTM